MTRLRFDWRRARAWGLFLVIFRMFVSHSDYALGALLAIALLCCIRRTRLRPLR